MEVAIGNLLKYANGKGITVIASANNQDADACSTSPGRLSRNNPNNPYDLDLPPYKVITAGGTMLRNNPDPNPRHGRRGQSARAGACRDQTDRAGAVALSCRRLHELQRQHLQHSAAHDTQPHGSVRTYSLHRLGSGLERRRVCDALRPRQEHPRRGPRRHEPLSQSLYGGRPGIGHLLVGADRRRHGRAHSAEQHALQHRPGPSGPDEPDHARSRPAGARSSRRDGHAERGVAHDSRRGPAARSDDASGPERLRHDRRHGQRRGRPHLPAL